jgi:hypothetical protein
LNGNMSLLHLLHNISKILSNNRCFHRRVDPLCYFHCSLQTPTATIATLVVSEPAFSSDPVRTSPPAFVAVGEVIGNVRTPEQCTHIENKSHQDLCSCHCGKRRNHSLKQNASNQGAISASASIPSSSDTTCSSLAAPNGCAAILVPQAAHQAYRKKAERRLQHSPLTTPSPQPRNSHTELQPTAPLSGAALQHVLRVDITSPAMTLHHHIEPPVSNSPECVSSPRLSPAASTPAQPTNFHHLLAPRVTFCLTSYTNHCKKQSHHNYSTNLLPQDRVLLRLTNDS